MNSMVERQNKTADGLRSRLFDALDDLIENKVDAKKIECICVVSEQIIKSAKLELEIELEKERIIKEKREFLRQERIEAKKTTLELTEIIDVLDV